MSESQYDATLLTSKEAFWAMCEFTWRFLTSAGDDLVTLVGDTELIEDGTSFDPAAWDMWLDCVGFVRAGGVPRTEGSQLC